MMNKVFVFAFVSMVTCATSFSCSDNIPDCPSKMCIVAGGWKLTEVYVDDEKDNNDLSKYSLMLTTPSPNTNTTSSFTRTQPSGSTDTGTWSLENNESILRMIPYNDPVYTEDWVIASITPRKLVLILHPAPIKGGPADIQFVLEPF